MKRIIEKVIYKHTDDTDLNGFSQIRKKSVSICINLCHLCAYCLLPVACCLQPSSFRPFVLSSFRPLCLILLLR
jgi:hypothetical protein